MDGLLPGRLSVAVATGGLGAAAAVLGRKGLEQVRAAVQAPAG
ncbi:MAG: hypothetical protein ACR2K2_04960 [Mycobacteriales bacterium]